jgi:hypothetical protein
VRAPARITGIRDGVVFTPFHYRDHAADELTPTVIDPCPKRPIHKTSAGRIERV